MKKDPKEDIFLLQYRKNVNGVNKYFLGWGATLQMTLEIFLLMLLSRYQKKNFIISDHVKTLCTKLTEVYDLKSQTMI